MMEDDQATEIVNRVTAAVREADEAFKKTGGGSRHWVRECFLPSLEKHGLTVKILPRGDQAK
jgi:hypothetical protein